MLNCELLKSNRTDIRLQLSQKDRVTAADYSQVDTQSITLQRGTRSLHCRCQQCRCVRNVTQSNLKLTVCTLYPLLCPTSGSDKASSLTWSTSHFCAIKRLRDFQKRHPKGTIKVQHSKSEVHSQKCNSIGFQTLGRSFSRSGLDSRSTCDPWFWPPWAGVFTRVLPTNGHSDLPRAFHSIGIHLAIRDICTRLLTLPKHHL